MEYVILDNIEEIEQLSRDIANAEVSIEEVETQMSVVETASTIISKEDATISDSTVAMFITSLEMSTVSLGLPKDILAISIEEDVNTTDRLQIALEAKDSFMTKMTDAVMKLYVKIANFVRKILMKVLTTLNFNKSNIEKQLKAFSKDGQEESMEFDDKNKKSLGKRFATLGRLTNRKEFVLNDIMKHMSGFINMNSSTLVMKTILESKTKDFDSSHDVLKILTPDFARIRLNPNNVSSFNFTPLESISIKLDLDKPLIVRADGDSISVLVNIDIKATSKYEKDTRNVKLCTAKLKDNLAKEMVFKDVPTGSEMLDILDRVKDVNDGLKSFIDDSFSGEKSIEKTMAKFYKQQKDNEGMSKHALAEIRDLQLLSPKLAQHQVMYKFKTIRNILALGFATAKARKIEVK